MSLRTATAGHARCLEYCLFEHMVAMSAVQCELQTERQRVVLSEASKTLQQLAAGGTHDFNISLDVKDREHALTCRCNGQAATLTKILVNS